MQNIISLLPALFIALLACANGVLLSRKIFATTTTKIYLAFGAVIGLAGLAWIGFLLALLCGLNWLSIAVTTAILLIALFFLRPLSLPLSFSFANFHYIAWLLFFGWIFARVMMIEPAGMYTAPANNFGDLPFHFGVVNSFAHGDNFPPHNPIFQGLKFTYPFLVDFLSAFFQRAGADLATSFFLPNIILALALVGLIEILTEKLTENIWAARVAPVLFFFSGGAGFLYTVRDKFYAPANWWDFALHLPQSYTKNDELGLQWGNVITTLLVPQRSLLFGFPVFAMIAILWWEAVREGGNGGQESNQTTGQPDNRTKGNFRLRLPSLPVVRSSRLLFFLTAGILAGLLPLLHAHGFFAVMMVSAALALTFFSWDWLAFFIPAGILSLPQALWLSGTGTRNSLFTFNFGWAHGEVPLLKFYALNFGIFLLTLAVALLFANARARRFYWPFLLCWLVPNVVLLAPWAWDNIKVLAYWYLLSVPFVALLLAKILQARKIYAVPFALALFGALIFSGALDITRSLSPVEKVQLFGSAELTVAEQIKERIPAHALLLCAPIHNSVLALAGRQMLMGYPGHLWSHGINFADREKDVRAILKGVPETKKLLKKYAIDYVVIGPVEYNYYEADEGFFVANFPIVIDEEGFRVFKTSP